MIPACEDFSAYANDHDNRQILIIQHQTLPVWRDIRFGYISTIENKKFVITQFNADSDLNKLDKYIDEITKTKPFDLIVSIGSITSERLLAKEQTVPILISGLASPEYSGIIKNWNSSGRNFAGAEIKNQTYNGLKYLHSILPFKKIGMIYISGEPSHEGNAKELHKLGHYLNFQVFSCAISNRDKDQNKYPPEKMKQIIREALEKVTPYVDHFYINLSKTFIDNYFIFNEIFIKNKILSIGDKSYLDAGCVVGITSDYFKRGEELAYQTNMILEQNVKPSDIKMDMIPKFQIEYNLSAAKKIEYNPSANFLLNTLLIQTELE